MSLVYRYNRRQRHQLNKIKQENADMFSVLFVIFLCFGGMYMLSKHDRVYKRNEATYRAQIEILATKVQENERMVDAVQDLKFMKIKKGAR